MNNDIIDPIIATFPKTFGLRAFPGDKFTIDRRDSYYSGDVFATRTGGFDHDKVRLYIHKIAWNGATTAFSKASPDELRREIVRNSLAKENPMYENPSRYKASAVLNPKVLRSGKLRGEKYTISVGHSPAGKRRYLVEIHHADGDSTFARAGSLAEAERKLESYSQYSWQYGLKSNPITNKQLLIGGGVAVAAIALYMFMSKPAAALPPPGPTAGPPGPTAGPPGPTAGPPPPAYQPIDHSVDETQSGSMIPMRVGDTLTFAPTNALGFTLGSAPSSAVLAQNANIFSWTAIAAGSTSITWSTAGGFGDATFTVSVAA